MKEIEKTYAWCNTCGALVVGNIEHLCDKCGGLDGKVIFQVELELVKLKQALAELQAPPTSEQLVKLLWDCHYLICTGEGYVATELIIEKLNPDAIKRRPKIEVPPEAPGLTKKIRQWVKDSHYLDREHSLPDFVRLASQLLELCTRFDRLEAENKRLKEELETHKYTDENINNAYEKGYRDGVMSKP